MNRSWKKVLGGKDGARREIWGGTMELEGKSVGHRQKLEKGSGTKDGSCKESWGGTERPGSGQGITPRALALLSPRFSERRRDKLGSPAGTWPGTARSNPIPGSPGRPRSVRRARSAHAPCLVLQGPAGPPRPGPSRPAGAAPGRAGRLKPGPAELSRVEPHRAG